MAKEFHIPPATVNAFQRDLLRWYRYHRRDLPWRRTRDPYKIWVSEIMLQQTRVEAVLDHYRRWIKTFPTVRALARAPFPHVLKHWEGLGYYTRARNLHRAAILLVGRGDPPGRPPVGAPSKRTSRRLIPTTAAELMKLPGIGRYTAGAIASIAFGERAPIVDGNVARVFARVFNIRQDIKSPATQKYLWHCAESLLPAAGCGDFNQALMELGALICLPTNPKCEKCPMQNVCSAPGDALPRRKKQRLTPVTHTVVFVRRAGKILLRQRPHHGQLAGMWELPPLDGAEEKLLITVRHTITNRRITLRVVTGKAKRDGTLRWVTRPEVKRLPLPAAHRKVLAIYQITNL
jgi:A/G-specific adenine glycosylase